MRRVIIAGLALAAAVAARAQDDGGYFVREGMVNHIDPPITAIWTMQAEVMDDAGNFDPALMDDGQWASLLGHARALDSAASRMAAAGHYAAADPQGTLGPPPEGTDLAAIDARLTDRSASFRAYARLLADQSGALVVAAQARDAGEVSRLTNDIQPVCKACHDVFWYPEEYAN